MLIFSLIVGIGLCLRGLLALANLLHWNNLPVAPRIRRLTGLAYLFFGVMLILSGIWHVLFVGAFVAMVLLLIAERKLIVERRAIGR